MSPNAFNLRPTEKSDHRLIYRLMEDHWAVHSRIFSEDLPVRLGQYIGFVAEYLLTLRAFFLFEPLSEQIALIAVVAVHNQTDVRRLLEAVYPLMEQALARRGFKAIMQFGEAEWLTTPLRDYGFFAKEQMLTFEWQAKALPDIVPLMKLHIRPARSADLPDILVIDHLAFSAMWRKPRPILRDALSRAALFTVAHLALDQGHKLVAYQWCERLGDQAHLSRIATHPDCEGQGIGTQLLHHTMQYLKARQVKRISLNTQEHNLRSQSLYQRFGFRKTKRVITVFWKEI